MSRCPDFSPIHPNQKKTVAWRFAAPGDSYLPNAVTLTGSPTVIVTDLNGVDSSPQGILLSTPAIGTFPGDPANTAIVVQLGKGIGGADYAFQAYCASSDGDQPEAVNHIKCYAPG